MDQWIHTHAYRRSHAFIQKRSTGRTTPLATPRHAAYLHTRHTHIAHAHAHIMHIHTPLATTDPWGHSGACTCTIAHAHVHIPVYVQARVYRYTYKHRYTVYTGIRTSTPSCTHPSPRWTLGALGGRMRVPRSGCRAGPCVCMHTCMHACKRWSASW